MTTITRFTKEQLIKRIEKQIDINATIIERLGDDSAAASELAVETATMDIKILDAVLTSLTSKPIYQVQYGNDWRDVERAQYDDHAAHGSPVRVVYAAPPAPVVHQEPIAWLNDAYLARGVVDGEAGSEDAGPGYIPVYREPLYAVQPVPVVPDEVTYEQAETISGWESCSDAWADGWNACRAAMLDNCATVESRNHADFSPKNGLKCAAMLQGSQPVSNRDELPEEKGASLQLRNLIRQRHAEWSDKTLGNVGPVGPLKHLSKEALEAAAEPDDLSEWADMQFLLWDAQRRAGICDGEITAAMEEKLKVNIARQWPEPKDGEPRLHIKEAGNSPVIPDSSEDTKRLNWLDVQNKRLNEYYGTSYGWKFDANFQRNAMMLNDSNYPVMTVRQAIDQAIASAPQQEVNRE